MPKTAGKGCLLLTYDPARVSHLPVRQSVRHPGGVGIVMDAWSPGLRGYAPRPRGYEAGTPAGVLRSTRFINGWSVSLLLKCTASAARAIFASQAGGVLILVLMEYGLRGVLVPVVDDNGRPVLILVLMEYGPRVGPHSAGKLLLKGVLILVLMEYGPREIKKSDLLSRSWRGLNPCFNGIWSARVKSVKICI